MLAVAAITTGAAPARVQVRVIDSVAEFARLEPLWERLQASTAITSVFASFDWQYLWWQTYGHGRQLRILLASDGGVPVGLLALCVERTAMLRYPVRVLRLVGTGGDTSPDDLGPLLERGREAEVARVLAEAVLALPGWDVLQLTDLDPACPFTSAMATATREAGLETSTGRCERIALMALPASWDAWLKSLSGDRRYRIKNIRKKLLAAHPDARFFVWDDPATLDQGIDRLVFLHNKRWEAIGQAHGFSTREYIGFHRAVMKACLARDRLRLYALELGGQVIAIYYFYKFRDTVYLMQSGFDPDFSAVKPGQVLLGHIVEHAIGEGHRVLDFLRGDHRYKDELASAERETVFLTALRPRPGAWVYRARRRYLPAVKAQLQRALDRVRREAPPKTP